MQNIFEKTKNNWWKIKLLFKDWTFVYKLVSFLITTFLIVLGLVFSVFIQHWYSDNNDNFFSNLWLANLDIMLSFWSVQTIILVDIWFLFALIYHNKESKSKISNFNTQLNITIYITITFLFFWIGTGISSFSKIDLGFDFYNFQLSPKIIGSLTHLLVPLSMIIYFFIDPNHQKSKFKNNIISILFYPILYLVYILIRASILIANDVPINFYPYIFLDFTKSLINLPIYLNSLFMILILIIIFWTFSFIFIIIKNKKLGDSTIHVPTCY